MSQLADEDAIDDTEHKQTDENLKLASSQQTEEMKVSDEQDKPTLPIMSDPACSQNGTDVTLGYESDACTEVMDFRGNLRIILQ